MTGSVVDDESHQSPSAASLRSAATKEFPHTKPQRSPRKALRNWGWPKETKEGEKREPSGHLFPFLFCFAFLSANQPRSCLRGFVASCENQVFVLQGFAPAQNLCRKTRFEEVVVRIFASVVVRESRQPRGLRTHPTYCRLGISFVVFLSTSLGAGCELRGQGAVFSWRFSVLSWKSALLTRNN